MSRLPRYLSVSVCHGHGIETCPANEQTVWHREGIVGCGLDNDPVVLSRNGKLSTKRSYVLRSMITTTNISQRKNFNVSFNRAFKSNLWFTIFNQSIFYLFILRWRKFFWIWIYYQWWNDKLTWETFDIQLSIPWTFRNLN